MMIVNITGPTEILNINPKASPLTSAAKAIVPKILLWI
ncbi:hypothetical protein FLA_5695 [Filimonas lacunae]|nr:hypothetical protein FLA_5695 [Filimonas lacunae]